jgi:hypothetical protein
MPVHDADLCIWGRASGREKEVWALVQPMLMIVR